MDVSAGAGAAAHRRRHRLSAQAQGMKTSEEWRRGWPVLLGSTLCWAAGISLYYNAAGFFTKPLAAALGWNSRPDRLGRLGRPTADGAGRAGDRLAGRSQRRAPTRAWRRDPISRGLSRFGVDAGIALGVHRYHGLYRPLGGAAHIYAGFHPAADGGVSPVPRVRALDRHERQCRRGDRPLPRPPACDRHVRLARRLSDDGPDIARARTFRVRAVQVGRPSRSGNRARSGVNASARRRWDARSELAPCLSGCWVSPWWP